MPARRAARAVLALGTCLAALAWQAAVAGPADARGASFREPGGAGRPMVPGEQGTPEPRWRERPPAVNREEPLRPQPDGWRGLPGPSSAAGAERPGAPAGRDGERVREPGRLEPPASAFGPGPREPRLREPGPRGQGPREQGPREPGPGLRERPPAAGRDREAPRGTIVDRPGQLTPDKIERWRRMSPEERERIRERYRQWKALPPERRERLLERRERWRELPEAQRRYLAERGEMYRNAWPEQRRAIDKFFVRWRQIPPERRRALGRRIAEWRQLPAAERDEQLTGWPFYNRLRPDEQRAIRWFLFSGPPAPSPRHE